jgi:hypothetical protein
MMLFVQACRSKWAAWERAAHSARACIAPAHCRTCIEHGGARGLQRCCRLAASSTCSSFRVHRCQQRHDDNRLGCGSHALHVIRRCRACDGRRRWPATAPAYASHACPPLKVGRRVAADHVSARRGRVTHAPQRAAHTSSACGTAATGALGVVALAPRHSATCGQHGVAGELRSLASG